MDWIEKLTGFAPDNGDGSFEFLIMFAGGTALVCVLILWRVPGAYAALRRLLPLLPQSRQNDPRR